MAKAIENHYNGLTHENVPQSIPDFYSQMAQLVENQPTLDEKEIIRKAMERIKARIDEKMESVDYWTKPYDKYEYYDNGYWEGMNEIATIVKEEGGIE